MEHDLFGKPVSTFPDHALKRTNESRYAASEESGFWRKRKRPAQLVCCNDRLRTIRDLQRSQNLSDVMLYGRLHEIERAANGFVAFTLHQQRKDLQLPIGKTNF
jgi:hypothetical protein